MIIWYADETSIYYRTGATKDLYSQMKANQKVEVCFFDTKAKGMDHEGNRANIIHRHMKIREKL